jgi:very-short-patch-repair endonuclease
MALAPNDHWLCGSLTSPRWRGEVGARFAPGEGAFSLMRGADKIRTALARRLRRDPTDAERILWKQLRSRALDGHKFVRQQPIGRFIADFACREKRLIIEVDGGQHADNERDKARDRWLLEHNYRVLRFWNNEIICNLYGVLEAIADALRADAPPPPVPASGEYRPLPPSGER